MDASLLNIFLSSLDDIFYNFCSERIKKNSVNLIKNKDLGKDVNCFLFIKGPVSGVILLSGKKDNIKQIIRDIVQQDIDEFDDLAKGAIREILNISCGTAATKLSELGLNGVDISPPYFCENADLTLPVPLINVELSVNQKKLNVGINLKGG